MITDDAHFLHSSRREKILENLFIGEILRELWRRKIYDVELLQSDIDAAGYDLVLSLPNGMRHIQLKASTKPKTWTVNGKISDKESGCVVVILVSNELDYRGYLWFGNRMGEPCDDIRGFARAKHSKADATGKKSKRKDTFKMSKSKFTYVEKHSELVDILIGEIQ